jgi:uncharacterized glyoxalase superfamily protein PhnB
MTASSLLPAPNLMPLMRYRDLAEAMSWLEQAFDFEKQIAVTDSDGDVIYGQMTYRGGLLMLGAIRDTELDKLMRQPDEVGGAETQSCYLVVEDADAHYAQAREAGAEILLDIKSDGLGRRGYSCRDPQGHIWNFGTYNPGRGLTMSPVAETRTDAPASRPKRRTGRLLMTLLLLAAGIGAAGWRYGADIKSDLLQRLAEVSDRQQAAEAARAYAELVKVRTEKRDADTAAAGLRKELDAERARRQALESNAGKGGAALADAETARRAAEIAVASLRTELKRTQDSLAEATEARRISEEKLAVKTAETAAQAATRIAAAPEQAPAAPTAPAPGPTATAPAPAGESAIETSATQPAAAPETARAITSGKDDSAEDKDGDKASGNDTADAASRGKARRLAAAPKRRKLVPTYVIDLQNVPWPYTTWYK